MNSKFKVLLFILGIYSMLLFAQTPTTQTEQPLKIGDTVPDITFNNVVNWHKTTAKLGDFKGKLVILDFWATWCVPCVKTLPKLDSLQAKFKDEIVILPITYESAEKILSVFKTNPTLNKLKLPSVTSTNLKQYFNYRVIPHEVWIDGNGKYIATTASEEVNENKIREYLQGYAPKLTPKKDIMVRDRTKPLLIGALGDYKFDPGVLTYSSTLIKGQIKGLASTGARAYVANDKAMIKAYNVNIQLLYQIALVPSFSPENKDFYLTALSRTIWEGNHKNYFYSEDTKNEYKLTPDSLKIFTYEMVLPKDEIKNMPGYMLQDLNRYFGSQFGLEGVKEKRLVKCWALTFVGDDEEIRSKGGKSYVDVDRNKKGIRINNSTIDQFMFWWMGFSVFNFSIPIINETNYNLPIDLSLDVDQKNFDEVRKELAKVGLVFKLVEREIDMIVIKNK